MTWKEKIKIGLIRKGQVSDYKFREYDNRLAIWKKDGTRLTWEEVQKAKKLIWGDCVAIEFYPMENEVINIKHTRHIWKINKNIKFKYCHIEFNKRG